MGSEELIGIPHEIPFGFVRIATDLRLGAAALPLERARTVAEGWLSLPQTRLLVPDDGHFRRVMELMTGAMATGAVLSDAVLASYAIANRARLCSNDSDFARFVGLDWENPLQG